MLKKHLATEAKKLSEKIKTMTSDLETSKKTLGKVNEKLLILKQQISDVQRELDAADISYVNLQQNCKSMKIYSILLALAPIERMLKNLDIYPIIYLGITSSLASPHYNT
jgi:predicted  nucleic acid-binding Zn-ribbon protein